MNPSVFINYIIACQGAVTVIVTVSDKWSENVKLPTIAKTWKSDINLSRRNMNTIQLNMINKFKYFTSKLSC